MQIFRQSLYHLGDEIVMSCYYSLPKFRRTRLQAMLFYYPRHVSYFPFLSFLCSDLGAVRYLPIISHVKTAKRS